MESSKVRQVDHFLFLFFKLLEIEEEKKKILKPYRKNYTVEELLQKEPLKLNFSNDDVNGRLHNVDVIENYLEINSRNEDDMKFEEEEENKKEIERRRRRREEELKIDEDEEDELRERPQKLVRIDLNKSKRPESSKVSKENSQQKVLKKPLIFFIGKDIGRDS